MTYLCKSLSHHDIEVLSESKIFGGSTGAGTKSTWQDLASSGYDVGNTVLNWVQVQPLGISLRFALSLKYANIFASTYWTPSGITGGFGKGVVSVGKKGAGSNRTSGF